MSFERSRPVSRAAPLVRRSGSMVCFGGGTRMVATMIPSKRSWSVPVAVHDISETGRRFDLVADEAARDAVAALTGLRALPQLQAALDVTRRGRDGLHVIGTVSARVEQTCVITLEPIENNIEASVDLVFAPPQGKTAATSADAPEPLVDGTIDLGAVATEFLVLAIDPYPRKRGAVFEPPPTSYTGAHPFAALAALKKGQGGADK
jgi:uncharacterized metal-binding protein YceD (DUF177 family)